MKIREELDEIYHKLWRGSDNDRLDQFRILLERFIPFPKWGFSFVRKGENVPINLLYKSLNINLEISSDFEMYEGLGSINFYYSRIEASDNVHLSNKREKMCKSQIVSHPKRSPYFHLFLENIPPEATIDKPELPVVIAFEKMRSSHRQLKELRDFEPAYFAALEAFCWEYYGDRIFRLFNPKNQSEREEFAQYVYKYYKANSSPEAMRRWEENRYLPPPWKLCL